MSKPIRSDLDMLNVARILNLPNPTSAQEPATKAYTDSAIEGLAWKDSCRVGTSSNTNIASPGATLDGVSMVSGDRVLARAQTAGAENGIYIWNGAATPMTRSLDANTAAELEQATVTVEEGTDAGATFRQTILNFTLGSSTVTFTSFGTAAPAATETTAGIAEIATQAEVDAGSDDARFVTPAKLAAYSGRIKKFTQNIGDGSATQYTVTHNLNTLNVNVECFENSGNYQSVLCDVERTSVNAVRLTFAAAPTSNAITVNILG